MWLHRGDDDPILSVDIDHIAIGSLKLEEICPVSAHSYSVELVSGHAFGCPSSC